MFYSQPGRKSLPESVFIVTVWEADNFFRETEDMMDRVAVELRLFQKACSRQYIVCKFRSFGHEYVSDYKQLQCFEGLEDFLAVWVG